MVREMLAARAEAIVGGFSAKAQRIMGAKKALEGDALAGAGGDAVPAGIAGAFAALQKEAAAGIVDLKDLAAFVRLQEPVCEDGNNFYVGMQDEVAKICDASVKALVDTLDKWVEYLEKRADMKEKATATKTTEEKSETKGTSGSNSTEKGEKEEKKEKADQSNSTSATTKSSTSQVVAERTEALARLDSTWQAKLALHLATVLFEQARCVDVVQKNMEKICDPRGDGGASSKGMLMY